MVFRGIGFQEYTAELEQHKPSIKARATTLRRPPPPEVNPNSYW